MSASSVRFLRAIVADARATKPPGVARIALEQIDSRACRDFALSLDVEHGADAAHPGEGYQKLADVLADAAGWIEDYEKQKRARANRIEWITVSDLLKVARVGRTTYFLQGRGAKLDLVIPRGGMEELVRVSSQEAATRKIRRLRRRRG